MALIRTGFLLGTLVFAALAAGQDAWEKPIAPGLIYRMEVDRATPRVIHALRLSLGNPSVRAASEVVGKTIFEPKSVTGRGPVSAMTEQVGALAGINGDFFAMLPKPTGNPLGITVRQGELLSIPSRRIAFGWGLSTTAFSVAKLTASVQSDTGLKIPIGLLNQSCPKDAITLNTPSAGFAVSEFKGVAVVLKTEAATWGPSSVTEATVEAVANEVEKLSVPADRAVLLGNGARAQELLELKPGSRVVISLKTDGFDWERIENVIGGGPLLLKDGKVAVDAEAQGFQPSFYAVRHPRTALGRTADGDLWFVAIDGRQSMSAGATLDETAKILQRLGCTDAINLDGGGSTTLSLLGVVANRPSDGTERAVANGVVFLGPKPALGKETLKIAGPSSIRGQKGVTLRLLRGKEPVSHVKVIWSAQGSAWVDQEGNVFPIANGTAKIRAASGGIVTETVITVSGIVLKKIGSKP